MITLTTGQPGAGKTLYTLWEVQALAEREGRPVYYSGIPDLRLPWIELPDPRDWWRVPPRAIVVIDEAQRVFRPRGTGSAVPEWVAKLETHRHSGIDLILITQHPMLVDANVRRLVGRHVHVVRTFGLKRATVHEWSSVKEQCDKSREDAIRRLEWAYPTNVFALYKSAEVHTHKARIPPKALFVLLVPVLVVGLIYGTYRWFAGRFDGRGGVGPTPVLSTAAETRSAPVTNAVKSPEAYALERLPRVPGLLHTAPVYDELTRPTRVPVPAACVSSARTCRCYTQDGTRLDVPLEVCQALVSRGFFADFAPEGRSEVGTTARESTAPLPSKTTFVR